MRNTYSIGIDIGTSQIEVVLINKEKQVIDYVSEDNVSSTREQSFESLQDADKILEITNRALESVLNRNTHVSIEGIGISNQMHGIVYVDGEGNALSPLYNWQDKRGDELLREVSVSSHIQQSTGYEVFTGYGLVTHFYNNTYHLVPKDTKVILDIGTFIASHLTGTLIHSIHPTNAQAWGLYDYDNNGFDQNALDILNIDSALLPSVEEKNSALGLYKEIPVYNAIGDNQAGFLGTVNNEDSDMFINIGTSAQLSFLCDKDISGFELRPFINGKKLLVTSSLCGGKTLDLWVRFLADAMSKVVSDIDIKEIQESIYQEISKIEDISSSVEVQPFFYGSRKTSGQRASIQGLTYENFNFKEISIAMIAGIVEELYTSWALVPQETKEDKQCLYITGGATRVPLVISTIKNRFKNLNTAVLSIKAAAAVGVAYHVLTKSR